jgi:ubiquitin-protein ligase
VYESPRDRRLRADRDALRRLAEESSILAVARPPDGPAPERWTLTFRGRGLWRDDGGTVAERHEHVVEVGLGPEYPRQRPDLLWVTPVFHPNVSGSGRVCLGGYSTHWAPSLRLDGLCEMLWDMLRYANFDVRSPYNLLAARWAERQPPTRFPVDRRPLRDRVAAARGPGAPAPPAAVRFPS